MNCFRILLYLFNIIFIILGITLVGIGIWTAVEKIYVSYVIGDTLFSAASYLIIAVGIFIILVCIVGIIALWKDNRKWLIIYLILLIVSFLTLIIAAVLAIVFKGEVESVMVNSMRKSIINGYGKDRDITSAWDQLQSEVERLFSDHLHCTQNNSISAPVSSYRSHKENLSTMHELSSTGEDPILHCCAISETQLSPSPYFNFPYVDNSSPQILEEIAKQDSWAIYKRTEFYRNQLNVEKHDRKYVPASCCVYDNKLRDYKSLKNCQYFSYGPPFSYASAHQNDNLYYAGCYEKGKQLVLDQSDILVAIGFVFAFLMVAGMVLTFFVIRSAGDDDGGAKHRRRPNVVV